MIYLFNSGFRPNYLQNIGRTLFLPKGWSNEYRYRFQGEQSNIDPTKIDEFLKLKNEDIIIVFVDRFAINGYRYHPIRKGKLIKCYVDGDKLFFKVNLQEYISPIYNDEFNEAIKSIGGLPQLTGNNPENPKDGFYAIKNGDITKIKTKFIYEDDAWDKITNDLKDTFAFKANNNKETVFARISMPSKNWFCKIKKPKIKNETTYFKINKNKQYQLKLFYKYPNQINNRILNLQLESNESVKILSEKNISIDNYSNNATINFSSKRYVEDLNDCIILKFNSKNIAIPDNLIAPNFTFCFKIIEGSWFWVQVILAIVLLGISEIISSTDLKSTPISLSAIISGITITKVIGVTLNGIALFWIFRIVGKKVM